MTSTVVAAGNGGTAAIDIAVIGLGSAGETFATRMARAGRTVVGFDPHLVGGECPFEACIPSKVLLHHVSVGSCWEEALSHRKAATDHLDDTQHAEGLIDAGVEIVRAPALLVDDHTVEADGRRWRADHVIIATGATPALPRIDGLDDDAPFWTSDQYLTADALPSSFVIIGGGAIGCELATVHRHFHGPVTLIDHGSLLGDTTDVEVAETAAVLLRGRGIDVRTHTQTTSVRFGDDDSMTVTIEQHGATATISADALLIAAGTEPNWTGLGLESIGIDDPPTVDDELRIAGLDWLRALGDVTGKAPWTHGANLHAEWLSDRLLDRGWPDARPDDLPRCVFTDPPMAAVGLSVDEAAERGLDVVRATATYQDIARGSTDRLDDGLVVGVADRTTGQLVGVSGVGARLDDIISTASAWISAGWTVEECRRVVIPFPTMTEILTPVLDRLAERLRPA